MATLWSKEITVNEQENIMGDFSSYLETSLMITIEKFKSIIILQKPGWLNVARDFLAEILPDICKEIGKYLVSNKIMNEPNWNIFLKERLEIATKAGQLIYDYHHDCINSCISQYQMQYKSTYEQQLAKQDGLGFGIISNSLTAHLVYAAQSVSKERENEKIAKEAADRIMYAADPIDRAIQMTIVFYHETFDPFAVNFLINVYADIEKLIYDGVGIDKEKLENRKTLSESELSAINENNYKDKISTALSIYPFNGNALALAFKYDSVDDELIEFCSQSPKLLVNYVYTIGESVKAYLKKQKESAALYNRDPLTDDTIKYLHCVKTFFTDSRISATATYDKIIQEIYGSEIDSVCKKFETLIRVKTSSASLSGYAKTHKSISVSTSDFTMLEKYNNVFGTKKVENIISSLLGGDETFAEMVSKLNAQISAEYDKHKKEEQERKQRELEHQREVERKKNEIKAEIAKIRAEIDSLGLAWFGKKAQRKAELTALIAEKTRELNNVK